MSFQASKRAIRHSSWLHARYGETLYDIVVENPGRRCEGVASVELDGQTIERGESPDGDADGSPVKAAAVPLVDDGLTHTVRVVLRSRPASPNDSPIRPASRSFY